MATNEVAGSFTRESPSVVRAIFVIENGTYEFVATLAATLNPFTTNNVTLTYESVDELIGFHNISGYIGENTFEVVVKDGKGNPTIAGDLNPPYYIPPVQIAGFGVWEPVNKHDGKT